NKLTKLYGSVAAIEDVSFEVAQGEIIGFLGPNGAGKSTTMRILTGFTPATSGSAKVAGFHVEDHPVEVKRRLGYMPENVPLYPEMLVASFLSYVADVKGVPRRDKKIEVDRVMERCGLQGMGKRILRNLSKGYRQRVGLAQALIGNPPVLILDEPTVGLDPKQIIEIRQMIKSLAEEHTVLLSTHILPEVSMICERVIIINRGRIVAQDTMKNLTRGGDQAALEIEAGGVTETVLAVLRGVGGVQNAERIGPGRYVVETRDGEDVREKVSAALVSNNCHLTGLQRRARTLEDVFVSVVAADRGVEV
ncbi:MAG: ATP-binding cassette domain-containing protein, partial [Candidatus Hydrogenedentes bacterium]|nr:ATP-binding cassette domain-containing protein [Candidatus Hydrogenedentota bacterium]